MVFSAGNQSEAASSWRRNAAAHKRPLRLRLYDWLTASSEPHSPELQNRIERSLIDDRTAITVSTLSIFFSVSIAIYLTGALWPLVWLVADLSATTARWRALRRSEHPDSSISHHAQPAQVFAALSWMAVFMCGIFACFISGNPALIVLSTVLSVAVAGAISSRVAALPRYAGTLIVLSFLPIGVGLLLSDHPDMRALATLLPFWIGGMIALMYQNYRLVVRMVRAELENRRAALTDKLTNIPNRLFLEETLAAMCSELRRGRGFALLCLDLDGFKPINDRFGHSAGDVLLQAVAGRIAQAVRDRDHVCRLGGDEFVVLLPDAGPSEAAFVAKRIIASVGRPFDIRLNAPVEIGVSAGSVVAPQHGRQPSALLAAGDKALYAAKSAGKGIHRAFLEHEEAA